MIFVFQFLLDLFFASGSSLLLNNVSLDYEATPVININVSATDNGSPPLSVQVCSNICFSSFRNVQDHPDSEAHRTQTLGVKE